MAGFSTGQGLDGQLQFTVTVKTHTDTYAFKYLRYVGLKKWVNQMTNPSGSSTSD